jgi:hypothetical protein
MLRVWFSLLVLGSALFVAQAAPAAKGPNLLRAEAFVDKQCPADTREISSKMWMVGWKFNALYGNCRAGDGRDQHIWFFSGGRFIGSDTKEPFSTKEIFGVWRGGDIIAFMYVLYRPRDPNCCPTGGGKIVRFRLSGRRLVRLDPLPANR